MSSNDDVVQTLCFMGLKKIDSSTYVQLPQSAKIELEQKFSLE